MEKLEVKVSLKEIIENDGLFCFEIPETILNIVDNRRVCFKAKDIIKCKEGILFEKSCLIPFIHLPDHVKQPGFIVNFRKDNFDLKTINTEEIIINFEYETLTEKPESKYFNGLKEDLKNFIEDNKNEISELNFNERRELLFNFWIEIGAEVSPQELIDAKDDSSIRAIIENHSVRKFLF
jgi:hypothetical protein